MIRKVFSWVYCPRLSVHYFLVGIPLGFYLGFVFFHYKKFPASTRIEMTCLLIQRSKTLENINTIKSTWLHKCDNYLIVKYDRGRHRAEEESLTGPTDIVSILGHSAWGSLCQALLLLPKSTKWLLIVPDSALVIMENLRQFLQGRDYREMVYAGHPVAHYLADYNALSAGIVLSYGVLARLWTQWPDKQACEAGVKYWNNEDILLGVHVGKLGAKVEDTRDAQGRGRFHGYNLHSLLNPGPIFRQTDYFKKALYPVQSGFDCCSNDLITIDTSDAEQARRNFFLTYGVGRRGILPPPYLEPTLQIESSWQTALWDIGYRGPLDNITSDQYYDIWMKYIPPEKLASKLAELVTHKDDG